MADIAAKLAPALHASGFDVLAPLNTRWYNGLLIELGLATDSTAYLEESGEQHASGEGAFSLAPLPDFGREGGALAFIVGNSRALWHAFLGWLAEQPDGASTSNPIDTFTAMAIERAVQEVAAGARADIFWASDMSRERLVDMNRAALVSGLTYFSEDMFLSVHPTFGAWVAFRAVVVLDLPATHLGDAPERLPPLLSEREAAEARKAFDEALRASSEVELTVDGMPLDIAHKWAAMRDCGGRGREHKYSALQSEYHYTKDTRLLTRALAEMWQTAEAGGNDA